MHMMRGLRFFPRFSLPRRWMTLVCCMWSRWNGWPDCSVRAWMPWRRLRLRLVMGVRLEGTSSGRRSPMRMLGVFRWWVSRIDPVCGTFHVRMRSVSERSVVMWRGAPYGAPRFANASICSLFHETLKQVGWLFSAFLAESSDLGVFRQTFFSTFDGMLNLL